MRNTLSLHDYQEICSNESSGYINHSINGPSPDGEVDERHIPTVDGSTGRQPIFELQHQGDVDLLATGAVSTSTWEASPDANHFDTHVA